MANLRVSYDRMSASATQLRTGQIELETRLGELRALVAQLVTDGFTTTAASGAFDSAYEQFTSGARSALSGIEGMAHFLDSAANVLQSTDEQLASRLAG